MRISVRPGPVRLAALGYRLCLLMMAASLTLSRAQAQALTGTIAGRVVDSVGAAVPSAKITVRNTDVASTRTLTAVRTAHFVSQASVRAPTQWREERADLHLAAPFASP
jgi:hypothetical protein